MKYNFVYDTDFLAKNVFNLSTEEVDIVLATIIGKHNAIFYGNKPERLVDAVKLLSHSESFVEQKLFSGIDEGLQNAKEGIMYLKDFDVWSIIEQQFLYSHTVNDPMRFTQFIATTAYNPSEVIVPNVLNNFDIIYRCKKVRITSALGNVYQLNSKRLLNIITHYTRANVLQVQNLNLKAIGCGMMRIHTCVN